MEALVLLGLHGNIPMMLGYIGMETHCKDNKGGIIEGYSFLTSAELKLRRLIVDVQLLLQWNAIFKRPCLAGLSQAISKEVT